MYSSYKYTKEEGKLHARMMLFIEKARLDDRDADDSSVASSRCIISSGHGVAGNVYFVVGDATLWDHGCESHIPSFVSA